MTTQNVRAVFWTRCMKLRADCARCWLDQQASYVRVRRPVSSRCGRDVPQKIKSLREKAHLSQAVFAAVLNTSLSTVQKWEIGDKKPSSPSLKLLNLIERKGLEAVL
ncbi:Helix-turn-helix [Nitrosomonas communis]|uniref:Helix-turn-helix n=1 Tax=Nitrosomonas communis TaxID=44574 RepID=A0A1I4NDI2_9PROT|nr:Helix-turn-helix [Nitrosomonas communis]